MKKIISLALLLGSVIFAQTGAPVDVNGFPTTVSQPTRFLDYDGSSNLIYVCYAQSKANNPTNPGYNFTVSFTLGSLTSVVVSANTGTVTVPAPHGLQLGQKVVFTGSTTSALNGTYYIQSVPSSTTYTVTTSGVSNATYTDPVISGSVPLLTGAIWSIQKILYNTSNLAIAVQWANGNPGTYTNICANRAQTTGATAIYYQ